MQVVATHLGGMAAKLRVGQDLFEERFMAPCQSQTGLRGLAERHRRGLTCSPQAEPVTIVWRST